MNSDIHRLIAYYKSDVFADDFRMTERSSPGSEAYRRSIISKLNDNLAAIGKVPTKHEEHVQELFASGQMSIEQMLDHMKLYIESIESRWPEE